MGVAGIRLGVDDPEAVLATVADLRADLADGAPAVVRSERGGLLQVADATGICGADHLRGAARQAVAARAAGEGIADDPALDVLLHAAGLRQISEALAALGLAAGDEAVAAVAVHPDPDAVLDTLVEALGGTRDDGLLAPSEAALDRLGIGPDERSAVPRDRWPDLALERSALLEVDK